MATEESSQDSMSQVSEPEPEIAPKLSLRAERSGIGSLLSSLRGDQLASAINQLSTSAEINEEKEARNAPEISESLETPGKSDVTAARESLETEVSDRPLNRKEKRRLQRLQEEKNLTEDSGSSSKRKATEASAVIMIAEIPTGLKSLYCDSTSFDSYDASFGYKSTSKNNYVHFSIQNNDGSHVIVASQDRCIRMYSLDKNEVQWKHNTGGLVLDAHWENSGKGVFSTSRLRPIQLFETGTGEIIGAYNGKDSGDNIKEAMCVGQLENTLIGGFKNHFQLWDIEYTDNASSKIKYYDPSFNTGITGISMSLACHPTMPDLFGAVGTTSLLGIYSMKWGNVVSTMEGSSRGYTDCRFSPDGVKLYASERSGDIHCFDTRMNMMTQILKRDMTTNHRTRFDIDLSGRLLYSGTSSGAVVVYDLHDFNEEIQPVLTVEHVASRCIPCVSVRGNKMVLCTGQRVFPEDPLLKEDDDVEIMDTVSVTTANSVEVFEVL